MVVAERKEIKDILRMIDGHRRILILGCGECVTVCFAGGEKEVGILASQLRMMKKRDDEIEIIEHTVKRQCDVEFLREIEDKVRSVESVLSLACGVGVQFVAENFPDVVVYPGLNTKFIGATLEPGLWAERCLACGECILDRTGGICPVTRCAKSLLNGPCGGSQDGKCEIDEELDCAWQLIYDRMKALGRLDELESIQPPKDWSKSREGGPRKVIREDLRLS
jgi:ferredoxin